MPCNCAQRLRKTLSEANYAQVAGTWRKGKDQIPDADIEQHHARITAMRPVLYKYAAGVTFRDALAALIDRRG
jgi:hypothetical protein